MTIRLADELRGSWSTFWATTFTFDVSTFEDFVLPRMASGSLAATVLADASRLATEWGELAARGYAVRANRDYLVRGIPIGGSFHAKTLFLSTTDRVRLMVGSGNLTLAGLGKGEVFSRFESGTPLGDAAIAAWRAWMESVVARSGDLELERRWRDLVSGLPSIGTFSSAPPFVSNTERPILDSLLDRLPVSPIDELHVAAPFWDGDCSAFTLLRERTQPKRVVLYLHEQASVNGERLRAVLEHPPMTEVIIRGWGGYVHAKLIGVVIGGDGVLLSGSPNLSDAALTLSADRPGANWETATIGRGSDEDVRAFFQPPGIPERELSLDEIEGFRLQLPAQGDGFPIRLLSAVRLGDGHIEVTTEEPLPQFVFLSNGTVPMAIGNDRRTIQPLNLDRSRFVRILAGDGKELSNAVPVDLPEHLQAFARRGKDASKPAEFDQGDMDSPVGWLLGWLHGECVFDVDEAVPRRGSESADEAEVGTSTDDDFWDRLQRDELRRDPRLARYSREGSRPAPLSDEVFLFIEMMLQRAPDGQLLRLIRGGESSEASVDHTPGTKWSPSARLRVRLFNVLARWIRSLGDPRLQWLDPLAPVRNYSALAATLLYCRLHAYLDEDRLTRLTHSLLAAIAGSDRSTGFLDSLGPEALERANEELNQLVGDTSSVLAFVALRSDRQADPRAVFEWQTMLRNARRLGLLTPTYVAAAVSAVLVGNPISREVILEEFQEAISYEDDPHWCERMKSELGLSTLQLRARSKLAAGYEAHLVVEPGIDLLSDPRIPRLACDALRYRKASGAMIVSGANRLSVKPGDAVATLREGQAAYKVIEDFEQDSLDLLFELGAGFVDLLPASRGA